MELYVEICLVNVNVVNRVVGKKKFNSYNYS